MKLLRRSRSVRCAECGYACLRKTKSIFLGDQEWAGGHKVARYDHVTVFAELALPDREPRLAKPPDVGSAKCELCCFRQASPLWKELEQAHQELSDKATQEGTTSDDLLLAAYKRVLNDKRDCKFWFPFSPGYGPELHRDLEQRHRDRTAERLWNIASVAFGAALVAIPTIIVTLVK